MAENKTQATNADVDAFLGASARPDDGRALAALMARITGEPAVMWGPSIVGFGRYRYRYASGREGEMCRIGFSPRKAELVLYVGAGRPAQADALARLGRHRVGKGCLYLKRLADADAGALAEIVRNAWTAAPEGEIAG